MNKSGYEENTMRISFIGAGRVATHLAKVLSEQHDIVDIYAPHLQASQSLAQAVDAVAVKQLSDLSPDIDLLIIAIIDRAIESCIHQLAHQFSKTLIVHTSGSTPLAVMTQHYAHTGVFYPLQTFSLEREVDWTQTPILIETAQAEDIQLLEQLAQQLSPRIYHYNSEQRLSLHLAAVFACNFSNYCYDVAAQLLEAEQVDFSLLHPLMLETANKATQNPPKLMQTGPAVRADQNIIHLHQQMLAQTKREDLEEVYQVMSNGILKRHHCD